MILYCKVGSLPGRRLVPVGYWSGVALRKEPTPGQLVGLRDPGERRATARPYKARLLEVRSGPAGQLLFVFEQF